MTLNRDPDPRVRRAQRVLLMVHELHKLGYQRLRIMPGMAPSGAYWRCTVTPVTNILTTHGAMARDWDYLVAPYTSSQENGYFGWDDARQDTARELAAKFIERFPDIVREGLGRDWQYVGWYIEMLGLAENGALPIAYADWYIEPDACWMPTIPDTEARLPMPPGGEALPLS